MNLYQIRPTFSEESLESWIWTNDADDNGFIIVKNICNRKKIKTFKRTIDENVMKRFNENQTSSNRIDLNDGKHYMIINEYYRKQLNINKNEEYLLNVRKATFIDKIFIIPWTHPNQTVQFGNKATIWALLIGLIALLLTIYSLLITIKTCK